MFGRLKKKKRQKPSKIDGSAVRIGKKIYEKLPQKKQTKKTLFAKLAIVIAVAAAYFLLSFFNVSGTWADITRICLAAVLCGILVVLSRNQ